VHDWGRSAAVGVVGGSGQLQVRGTAE